MATEADKRAAEAYRVGMLTARAILALKYAAPLRSIAANVAHLARGERDRDSAALLVSLADDLTEKRT